MAAMLAKCLFTALLFLPTSEPLTGESCLKAVSIGGFTWNLDESQDSHSFATEVTSSALHLQSPNCKFAKVALIRQQLAQVEKGRAIENYKNDQQWMADRAPFDLPIRFQPNESCYFVDHDIAAMFPAEATDSSIATGLWESLPLVRIQEFATQLVRMTADRMTPVVTGLAKGAIRTATWTARHARFPVDSFALPVAKVLDDNNPVAHRPLDIDQEPMVGPMPMPRIPARQVSSSKASRIHSASFAKSKSAERMDEYWNYYADCDRWHVVIAGQALAKKIKPVKSETSIFRFAWFTHVFESASHVDLWLTQAIRHLESQGEMIGRDFQRTWQDIEFRALEASFANSLRTPGNADDSNEVLAE